MNRITACATALAIALLSGTAEARPLKRAEEARIKPAGTPLKCITIRAIQSTHVRSDRVIDFYMRGDEVVRSRLPRACPGLLASERFSFTTDLPQICYVDSITVLRGTPPAKGATCTLGRFQPIRGAPKPITR